MPTLVSDGIKNGKQKGPGTDASMITAMKRNRAVLNGLTSEKFARDPFQLAVTSTSGNGTTMTYNFAAQNDIPFDVNDAITVTGAGVSIAADESGSLSVANVTATITATSSASTVTMAAVDPGILRAGMIIQAGSSGGGITNNNYYLITNVNGTTVTIRNSNAAGTTLTDFTGTGGTSLTITMTVTTGGSLALLTFPTTTTAVFAATNSITVSGHSVAGCNGTFAVVGTPTATQVRYQTLSNVSGTTSTSAVRIVNNSSPYSGTLQVLLCAANSLTITGTGQGVLTATISGFRRSRTKPIVDSINSRGYLVSGVLPVLTARGMNLSFFPVS